MMQAHRKPPSQRGLTLIELLTTLVLIGTLLGLAVPSLHTLVQQRRLDGAVQTYLSQLHWARLQAVALNQPVYIGFGQTPAGSCYLFYTGERDRCSCGTAGSTCAAGAQLLLATELPQGHGVSVATATKIGITVNAVRGTVTPTFIARFTARGGHTVEATTSVMGRTRTCSPAPGVPGWPACA